MSNTDPIILGNILLLQSTLHVMSDDAAMARFVCRGLSSVPGIDSVSMFLRGEFFSESNLLQNNNGKWNIKDHSIKMTSSINSILMARIDRLSNLVKETVKAAAVIGREFEVPVLTEVMKEMTRVKG